MFDCEGDGVRCRAGKSSFWITWDGRMLLCGMMDAPSCDVFELGFPAAWETIHAKALQLRLSSECAACDSKDVCRTCAAMTYTETGCYDKKPQYRCDLLRATPPACRALLKES